MGAILDILPRCIDMRGPNGELTEGVYTRQLTEAIRHGAYDAEGHMNACFLHAGNVGPFSAATEGAWQFARLEAAHNHGLTIAS